MYMSKMNGAYSEGLGGAKTLRGILRNRIVGDGIVYGNFEFRWKVFSTVWFNQNFYFALSTFFDTGRVIKIMKLKISLVQQQIIHLILKQIILILVLKHSITV